MSAVTHIVKRAEQREIKMWRESTARENWQRIYRTLRFARRCDAAHLEAMADDCERILGRDGRIMANQAILLVS